MDNENKANPLLDNIYLDLVNKESFSRGQLLLRTLTACLIFLPQMIWAGLLVSLFQALATVNFILMLFTKRLPPAYFNFLTGIFSVRLGLWLRVFNLADGYPAFAFHNPKEKKYFIAEINSDNEEIIHRGILLLRFFFGSLLILPHLIILAFRSFVSFLFCVVAFFAVLFTGRYPKTLLEFNLGTVRWALRALLYFYFVTHRYPPFTGKL